MALTYREAYQVPFYESDVNQNMKLPQLLSLALQISGKHSLKLGVSDDVIFNKYNLVWIITEYDIEIDRLPKYAETIEIETEAIAYNKLFCYRDFRIFGQDGQQIMTIHSTFVLMDFDTRKVHTVVDDIVKVYECEKIKKIIRGPRYSQLDNPTETLYHVRFFDLDMNGHVNNSKYLEWMYESLEYDFLLCHVPKKIQLKYIKEVAPTSQVSSRLVTTALHSQHEIVVEGHIHAQATIEWRERDDAR